VRADAGGDRRSVFGSTTGGHGEGIIVAVLLPDPLPEELAEPFVDVVGSSDPAVVRSWLADYAARAPVLDAAASLPLCRERVCEWLDAKETNEELRGSSGTFRAS
jgi:hypothetical protein